MTDIDLSPIWMRIDQHGKALQDHEVSIKLGERRLDQHEQEFRRISQDIVMHHGQVMTEIKNVGESLKGDIQALKEDYQQRQGAKAAKLEGSVDFKLALAAIGVVCTVITVIYMVASR
jgi:hypothetical protein